MKSLLKRSLRHYWRTNLGVVLGSALATLVLTGALMVGDSVKATLRQQAEMRVGKINDVEVTGDRFLPDTHLPDFLMGRQFPHMIEVPSALMFQGSAATPNGNSRANKAHLIGVTDAFWKLSPSGKVMTLAEDEAAISMTLATQLNVKPGDSINLRAEKPGRFSKDAPLSGEVDEILFIKVKIAHILNDDNFGRFALTTTPTQPNNIFIPLKTLQKHAELEGKANLFLSNYPPPPKVSPPWIDKSKSWLSSIWRRLVKPKGKRSSATQTVTYEVIRIDLANFNKAELTTSDLSTGGIEVRTPRTFIDDSIVSAVRKNEGGLLPPGLDSLTYFVNELSSGDKATPYSMVTALDAARAGFVPADLKDDEMVISQWLAEDLGVKEGASVALKYFVMGERRQLLVQERTFSVRAVLPMSEPELNTSWMPDFPGMSDKDSCRDWEPGFDFDAKKIRDKDEEYWKVHRGTPKAFITLKSGQEMWGNRWGKVTSIRYPPGTTKEQIERMGAFIDPAALGFKVIPLREQAFAATDAPVDFGQLFVSFSFFLIIAAAILTGLLFTFSVEQRSAQAGLLLAVGWRPKQVRKLFIREGLVLAVIGSVIGVGLAAVYTKLVLHGLATIWSGAAGGTRFLFAPNPETYLIGIFAGIFMAWLAMRLASRRLFARQAAELLSGEVNESGKVLTLAHSPRVSSLPSKNSSYGLTPAVFLESFWLIAMIVISLIGLLVLPFINGNPIAFFGLGFLLLAVGILFCRRLLYRLQSTTNTLTSLSSLALRNTSRRRGRSLATIAVLASGVFMVVSVDSFRKTGSQDYTKRDSGTGGFALIGESASPIYEDLNTAKGRDEYALDDKIMEGVTVVPFRVRDGDDASCLNLNRAMQPRLLGVKASDIAGRFRLSETWNWNTRNHQKTDIATPALVDANTLQWALQKKLGDTLDYQNAQGQPFPVSPIATLSGSILQGVVIISEDRFIQNFPNEAGYRFFLIDCPADKLTQVREHLSKQLQDRGLELTPSAQRLAEFNAVENTYLSIFQVLGGLGMLLGSAGLSIVVARNVLERRSEFALLEAVGFTQARLRRLVFTEHRWLIVGALVIGTLSALIAVWPNISQRSTTFPWLWISALIAGMTCLGTLWVWLATRLALRRSQLSALRNE